MLHERIYLEGSGERAYLDTYASYNTNKALRDAVLIFPGGGYAFCSPREGEPVALAYVSRGINAFVLNYRAGEEDDVYPKQLTDAARAILHIRQNAERYGIKPDRVFVVGFSAGGHLAGSLGLLCDDREVLAALGVTAKDIRPDGMILAYPVVSAVLPTHEGSFIHLAGKPFDKISDAQRRRYSLELHVDENSPPVFIWHTAKDCTVPPCGSLSLAQQYIDKDRTVMLKIYPYGGHGLSLANEITANHPHDIEPVVAHWLDESVEWLKTL